MSGPLGPERAASLLEETLHRFDEVAATEVLRRCIRIAALRDDMRSLWWLEMEASTSDKRLAVERVAKYSVGMSDEERRQYHARLADEYIARRAFTALGDDLAVNPEPKALGLSVGEIEASIEGLKADLARFVSPPGMHPVDLYFEEETNKKLRMIVSWNLAQHRAVLTRIREALHAFLVRTESELLVDERVSTVFERARRYVEEELREVAPEVSDMFASALRRLDDEEDPEALSHAATTTRRILKTLADRFYPPRAANAIGRDGKARSVTDDKYRNRLAQFVDENSSGTNRRLIEHQFNELLRRIDLIDEIGSKGVHDRASRAEGEQVVMQAYLLTADLLRLRGRGRPEADAGSEPWGQAP